MVFSNVHSNDRNSYVEINLTVSNVKKSYSQILFLILNKIIQINTARPSVFNFSTDIRTIFYTYINNFVPIF